MPRRVSTGLRLSLAGLLFAASTTAAQVRTVLQEPGTAIPVSALALSPNGKTAAWGGKGRVRIGDAKTGVVGAEWPTPGTHLAFAPDGKHLLNWGFGFAVWDAIAGKEVYRDTPKGGVVDAVAPPGSGAAVLANATGRVWVIDLATGGTRTVLQTGTAAVGGVTYSPDGQLVAAGDATGRVQTWDRETGKPVRTYGTGGSSVSQLEFTSDGETLTATRLDGTVNLWNTADGTQRAQTKGRARTEWTVAFTPDGNHLAFQTTAGVIEVWDLRAARRRTTIEPNASTRFGSLMITPDAGFVLLSPSHKTETVVFDVTTGKDIARVPRGTGASDLGDGGKAIVVSLEPRGVRLYDAAKGTERGPLEGFDGRSMAASCSPDARWAAAGNSDEACVWDTTTRQRRCRLAAPGRCGYLMFSPDARFLAGGGNGLYGTALWNGETGELISTLPDRANGVWAYKFRPDSKELLVGTLAGGVRAFDAAGKLVATYQSGTGSGRLAASPDGSRVAFGSAGGEVAVWDAKTWDKPVRMKVADDAVTGLAFAPSGGELVASARDGAVTVWDAAGGDRKHELAPAGGPPLTPDPAFNPVAYSADGKAVAAGSGDGKVRVWDAATGEPAATTAGHTGAVRSVFFEGSAVVSVGSDDAVRVWDATTGAERENLAQRLPSPHAAARPGLVLVGSSSGSLVRIEPGTGAVRTLARMSVPADRLALSPDGTLAVLMDAERATLWPLAGDRPPVQFEPRSQVVTAFAPDGKTVALGTAAGHLELWDAKTLTPLATLARVVSPVMYSALSADGAAVAVATQDGALFVWDAAAGKVRWGKPPPANRAWLRSVAFADRGRLVVGVTYDGNLRVHDAATGEQKYTTTRVEGFAAEPSRALLALADDRGEISFWADAQKAPRALARTKPARAFNFCAGGATLLVHTGTDAELWDVAAGKQLASRAAVRTAASPDGGHLVLTTEQESVVLDAATGKPVGKPLARTGVAVRAEVGNGGRFAIDWGPAGPVVWETATGKPVSGLPAAVRSAAVAPDGTTLAVGGADGVSVVEYAADPPVVRFTDPGGYGPPAFTADGRFLFAATSPPRAWDAATGKTVPGFPESVTRMWGNAAGGRALVADRDNALRLVTFGKAESAVVHSGRSRQVQGLAFTPDGRTLLAAGYSGLTQYDVAERREARFTSAYFSSSVELTVTPDGHFLAAGSGGIWRFPAAGSDPPELVAHKGFPQTPPVSPDGNWGLVASTESWFLVDVGEKKITETAKIPGGLGARAAIAPNGKFLAVWPDVGGGACRVFTFPGLEERCGLDSPVLRTLAAAWSPDSTRLAVFGSDGVVRVWHVPAGRFAAAVPVPGVGTARQAALRFSADGKQLVVGTDIGSLVVLDVAPGREQAVFRGHTGAVLAAAVSPDGQLAYTAAADKMLWVWTPKTGRSWYAAALPDTLVLGLAVSPDGRRLALAGADGSVRLWDAARLRELRSWSFPAPVWCVAFSPDGATLAAGCDDGTVRVIPASRPPWPFNEKTWPVEAAASSLAGNAGAVFALAFAPDGATLYAGTGTFDDLTKPGRVLRWGAATGKRGEDVGECTGAVLALAATADVVAAGGADRAVTVWKAAGGAQTLTGHKVTVRGLAFLPGGRLLSAGGVPNDPRSAGEVKVWDLATRREVPPLLGQRSGVSAVAASADGTVVVTAGWDELVRVWNFGTRPAGENWWPWPGG